MAAAVAAATGIAATAATTATATATAPTLAVYAAATAAATSHTSARIAATAVAAALWPSTHHAAWLTQRVGQGMLLDLGVATLTVYVNGERKGAMVRPDIHPMTTTRLEGPMRWAVDLYCGFSTAIDASLPLPAEA